MSAVNLLVCTFIAKYPYQMAAIEVRQAYRIFNSFFYDLFYEFALFIFHVQFQKLGDTNRFATEAVNDDV